MPEMDELLVNIPEEHHAKIREVTARTDTFCAANLNEEYRDICRELVLVCTGAGVPMDSGKAAGWAAGIVATAAYVNFLGDPTQPHHMTNEVIAKKIGSSPATLQNKLKIIRETLRIQRMDPQFSTQAVNEKNPHLWLVSLDGMPVDVRLAPREFQEAAFRAGQIPYIPGERPKDMIIRHWMPSDAKTLSGSRKKKTGKK
jgi:hypothetical protein